MRASGATRKSPRLSAPRHRWLGTTWRAAWLAYAKSWRYTPVLDLDDQLQRYAEALEQNLLEESAPESAGGSSQRRPRQRMVGAAAAIVALLAVVVAILADSLGDRDRVATGPIETAAGRPGVFTTTTDAVLLFTDGIDGAMAVDLDRRLVGRRVIDGERAGDQQFRLTLTGDHLVVGWGEIFAAPIDGAQSRKIADATIFVPASEEGEVWTLTWEGGRIGSGAATLRRVGINGSVVFEAEGFDPATYEPVVGVPGGLLVNTRQGVTVWDGETGDAGPVLGPGRAVAATTDGQRVAWCANSCADLHTAALLRTGPPTARHVAAGAQQLALSPDGTTLAVVRPVDDAAQLVLTDPADPGNERVVAAGLPGPGAVMWSPSGGQLFFTEGSYGASSMLIGLYDMTSQRWESQTIPVGDGLAPIAVTHAEARSFFTDERVPQAQCPGAGGAYPSGREGVCMFAFFTPDTPDECVADGPATIDVPDTVGLRLEEAAIRMQLAGLTIVDTGVATTADPQATDAVVRAHEPTAGATVPAGACVGFRTSAGDELAEPTPPTFERPRTSQDILPDWVDGGSTLEPEFISGTARLAATSADGTALYIAASADRSGYCVLLISSGTAGVACADAQEIVAAGVIAVEHDPAGSAARRIGGLTAPDVTRVQIADESFAVADQVFLIDPAPTGDITFE